MEHPNVNILNFLKNTSFFKKFSDEALVNLVSYLKPIPLKGGERLITEGEVGASLYIVESGRLIATRNNQAGGRQTLNEIGRGEIVGEIALMTGIKRTASVHAIRDSMLLEFTSEDFQQFTQSYPAAGLEIAKFCVERLVKSKSEYTSKVKTLVFAPAGENPLLPDFVREMAELFKKIGKTVHLNNKSFDQLYGKSSQLANVKSGIDREMTAFLDDIESQHDFILFETDLTLTNWTSLCLRQADRIILVGFFNEKPTLNEIEVEVNELEYVTDLKVELVLLHSGTKKPIDTDKWLAGRKIYDHYHIKYHQETDYQKLIRFITNTPRSLVLSGGGSRGFAYIGLFRALEELKISFDLVAGSSAGSLVTAYYAAGLDSKGMDDATKKITASLTSWSDFKYTLPLVSLFNGNFLHEHLTDIFQDLKIEDLWIKFFCVGCNLSKRQEEIFSNGLLRDKLRKSMAVPGLLPPVISENGNVYVDGGIMNNFPADIVRKRAGNGKILGVTLNSEIEAKYTYSQGVISGWKVLWNNIIHSKDKLSYPHIGEVIISSIILASLRHEAAVKKDVNLCIDLDVSKIGLVHTAGLDALIDESYQACKKQLEDYLKTNTF